jgi:hypothetical protein
MDQSKKYSLLQQAPHHSENSGLSHPLNATSDDHFRAQLHHRQHPGVKAFWTGYSRPVSATLSAAKSIIYWRNYGSDICRYGYFWSRSPAGKLGFAANCILEGRLRLGAVYAVASTSVVLLCHFSAQPGRAGSIVSGGRGAPDRARLTRKLRQSVTFALQKGMLTIFNVPFLPSINRKFPLNYNYLT